MGGGGTSWHKTKGSNINEKIDGFDYIKYTSSEFQKYNK